ncbi:MAG TPA: MoxR family ATPase [Candidatus Tyrphobacter sp.]
MNSSHRPGDVIDALHHTIVGQDAVVEALLLGLLANGHMLLEGPPGLAKTLACRALAAALEGEFRRVQFTPDLLPSDIVGTRVFDQRESRFTTMLGPIFANVVLADEINRAPAKVQSALLEAMQERQVTIGLQSFSLPDPFIVMATMNPFDADGTYQLPLAQMDRFLIRVGVAYPTRAEELTILDRFAVQETEPVRAVASMQDVLEWRKEAHAVHLDEKLKRYIVELVAVTREAHRAVVHAEDGRSLHAEELIDHGASPRATLAIAHLARAKALLARRDYAIPDDVRAVAPLALRHRIDFSYRLATEGIPADRVIEALIAVVPAP